MQFTDMVTFGMEAPKGWKQTISITEYEQLSDRQKYYEPIYAKYRTVKRRSYDIDTGQFCGWEPHEVGVGDPVGYKYIGYWAARTVDQVLGSNVLMSRILNKKDWK